MATNATPTTVSLVQQGSLLITGNKYTSNTDTGKKNISKVETPILMPLLYNTIISSGGSTSENLAYTSNGDVQSTIDTNKSIASNSAKQVLAHGPNCTLASLKQQTLHSNHGLSHPGDSFCTDTNTITPTSVYGRNSQQHQYKKRVKIRDPLTTLRNRQSMVPTSIELPTYYTYQPVTLLSPDHVTGDTLVQNQHVSTMTSAAVNNNQSNDSADTWCPIHRSGSALGLSGDSYANKRAMASVKMIHDHIAGPGQQQVNLSACQPQIFQNGPIRSNNNNNVFSYVTDQSVNHQPPDSLQDHHWSLLDLSASHQHHQQVQVSNNNNDQQMAHGSTLQRIGNTATTGTHIRRKHLLINPQKQEPD